MIKEKTHLNKEVATIYWKQRPTDTSGIVPQPGHVLVRCSDGTIYAADHVIVTTSLGVLKNKVHSLFRPSLPDNKLIAIKVCIIELFFLLLTLLFFFFCLIIDLNRIRDTLKECTSLITSNTS